MPESVPYAVVLGVAQDAGHPQPGCREPCCRPAWADPALGHLVSCLGIVDPAGGRRWLIDATPDLPQQLRALDALQPPAAAGPVLDGIFVTHAHTGHYTGLMHLGRETMASHRLPLYAMPRMAEFLRSNGPWSQLVELENIELRPLQAGQATALSDSLSIEPFVVPHRDEFSETVGFVVAGANRRIAWLPDIDRWQHWDRRLADLVREVDVAFIDGTFYDHSELQRDLDEIPHPLITESMDLLADLPAQTRARVRFIHLNHSNPVLQPESRQLATVLERGFGIGHRGDRFDLS